MRVAVFGAGYAGLTLARRLEGRLPAAAELLVVDDTGHHLVQHELHRAIRRPAVAEEIRLPLADLLDRATIREARVADVDPEAGVATLSDGDRLDYDVGAVCLGAETAYYGIPGLEAHGQPLKRLPDAAEIRARFLDVLQAEAGSVVVGGAGLSGIQVAGELAELARAEGQAESVEIRLLEQRETVAPAFPSTFGTAVAEALTGRGVDIRTDATVTGADADAVHLADGAAIDVDQLIWTGGIAGPAALSGSRPTVRDRLQLANDTFVLGDAAQVIDADGEAVPASAQTAVREARVVAENVERLVEHRLRADGGFEPRLSSFRFDSPGWLVSVGDDAVAQVGSAVLTGTAAKALKTSVGVGYLSSVGDVRSAVEFARDELAGGDGPPHGEGP